MSGILNTLSSIFSALAYYLKTAVSVLTSNVYLMVGSLILLLTIGKSFNIGKLISYRSK